MVSAYQYALSNETQNSKIRKPHTLQWEMCQYISGIGSSNEWDTLYRSAEAKRAIQCEKSV
jgi:hypothetical protein